MRIRLVEYKCIVNDQGQPYGHALRALKDALKICEVLGYEVEVAASKPFLSDITQKRVELPNSISVNKYTYKSLFSIINNLRSAVNTDKDTVIWFTNVDWYLFLFLGIYHIKQNAFATIYKKRNDIIGGFKGKKGIVGDILTHILQKGIKRIDLYFETFFSTERFSNAAYVPDYMYTSFYEEKRSDKQNERVICPGTINTQKDILGLVEAFAKIDYPLLIVGEFADKNLYLQVNQKKTDNIEVDDRRLSYDEYCQLIATSKYCITPYDMTCYSSATSGVLREAVYLGSTPIAPKSLLNNTGFSGIGYESLRNLADVFNPLNTSLFANNLEPYKEENVIQNVGTVIRNLRL